MGDLISRQGAIDALEWKWAGKAAIDAIKKLPSAQPFHITTLDEVLEYIDGMPEDAWLEFTECLACRGWELQRRTAKWCGGDFA